MYHAGFAYFATWGAVAILGGTQKKTLKTTLRLCKTYPFIDHQ